MGHRTVALRFSPVFRGAVERSTLSPRQRSRLSDVPTATLVNWLNQRVRCPRSELSLLQAIAALRLAVAEADALLQAAEPPLLAERQMGSMLAQATAPARAVIEHWLAVYAPARLGTRHQLCAPVRVSWLSSALQGAASGRGNSAAAELLHERAREL